MPDITYKEYMQRKLRSVVYNALEEIMFDNHEATEADLDDAVEWFKVHFFEEAE